MFEANQINIPSRYLYCLLLKYCGKDECCFPSQETLGKIMGYSVRQIRNLIKELETQGLIYGTRKGWNRSNTYKVSKSLQINRKSSSPLIGSVFPLHQGNTVPTISTYIKGKDKRSTKGLESLRNIVGQIKTKSFYSYKK